MFLSYVVAREAARVNKDHGLPDLDSVTFSHKGSDKRREAQLSEGEFRRLCGTRIVDLHFAPPSQQSNFPTVF